MRLSDLAIKGARPQEKMYRLSDGGGLYLEIYPNGSKLWRIRMKKKGKETMLSLGACPETGLKDARLKRDTINIQRAAGVDSVEERRKVAREARAEVITFEAIYIEWLDKRKPPFWSQGYFEKTRIRADKHMLPIIGNTPVADIGPLDVLNMLRPIEKRGTHDMAHRVLGICSQVMRYAVATGIIPSDPCRDLVGALTPAPVRHNPAITDPLSVGKLLLDIDVYHGVGTVRYALKLLPLVFCEILRAHKCGMVGIFLRCKRMAHPGRTDEDARKTYRPTIKTSARDSLCAP